MSEYLNFTPVSDSNDTGAKDHVISQAHFNCEKCGADLVYSPKSQDLVCTHCGHHYPVPTSPGPIQEFDFESAVRKLEKLQNTGHTRKQIDIIQCPSCGAQFTFDKNEHAGVCPYCATPVVASTARARFIHPRSLLPFKITQKQAIEVYDKWIGSRWFAPSSLKNHAKRDEKLTGIYLPYWTYDSQTFSHYRGLRGIVYYDRQVYTAFVNGRAVQRVRTVPRVRWTPASGQINLHFDDVLIGASKTLPRTIINHLKPWDLENLVPYSAEYISGFRSELYQITVDQGFLQAENIMEQRIRQAVRQDIGGDQQRISELQTRHQNTTFKHLLLPVWSAAYKYRGKTYRYVINGRNGVIQGERPYSIFKIAIAAITAIIVLLVVLYVMDSQGMLDAGQVYFDTNPQGFNIDLQNL